MKISNDLYNRTECIRCVLTINDDPTIEFDEHGVCNYCNNFDNIMDNQVAPYGERMQNLKAKLSEIKRNKKSKYDCILGVSGGVDSTYLAYWAWKNELNPLLVHMDNGWNSELAVKNIDNIINYTNFDLHTHVLDWEEFKQLQIAYLKASVIDIEVLTDHAISAIIHDLAQKYNINYVLTGWNNATELIMPKGWTYDKTDFLNIKDIAKQYGQITSFKTFPKLTFWKKLYYHFILKLERVDVLNYLDYNKEDAKSAIIEQFNWKDYGGKHYESLFTKFYQAYILPTKFGIDKRKAHLSSLICSGQITKTKAKNELAKDLYKREELEEEMEYILKKLRLSNDEFEAIMKKDIKSHKEFDTDQRLWNRYFSLTSSIKRIFK